MMFILSLLVLYTISALIFYFGVYRPRQRQQQLDQEQAAQANSDEQTPVVDRDFVARTTAAREAGLVDPRTRHIAEVLSRWNPGDIENPGLAAYKGLALQVFTLLGHEPDVAQFQRDLGDMLMKRFARIPEDTGGMAVYFTNWYTVNRHAA